MNNTNREIENKYLSLQRKAFVSRFWFYLLNIMTFILATTIIVFNVYAIIKNPFDDIKAYFVVISIMTSFVAFLTSLFSFFSINKKTNRIKEEMNFINSEYKKWEKSLEEYKVKNKDEVFIDKLTKFQGGTIE